MRMLMRSALNWAIIAKTLNNSLPIGVMDSTGQALGLGSDECISGPARSEGFSRSGAIRVPTGNGTINIDPRRLNIKGHRGFTLRGELMLLRGYAGREVRDPKHVDSCVT